MTEWLQAVVDERVRFPTLLQLRTVVLPFSPQFNPNVVSERNGNTFLHILCEAIESCWENTADDVDIHDVAHPNHELFERIEFMLSVPNIDVNIRNREGYGIIHILRKARPVLKLLLEFAGTDIDLTCDNYIYGQQTAFLGLCRESARDYDVAIKTIAMFLEAGCNVNFSQYNNTGLNVLVTTRNNLYTLNPVGLQSRQRNEEHMRVRRNTDESIFPIIELLLRYGADPNVRANPTQETIFGKVVVHEWPLNMVALFLEYGGNPLLPHTPHGPRIIDLAENSPQLQAWILERRTTVIKSLLRRLPMDARRRVVQESLAYHH